MIRKILGCCAIALSALLLAGCWKDKAPQSFENTLTQRGRETIMKLPPSDAQFSGTFKTITWRTVERASEALDGTIHESDIAKLNRIGKDARIQISKDAYRLLDLARHYAVQTGGNYDLTTAPVAYLWGFEGGTTPTNLPPDDVRQTAMLGIGPNNISFFDNGSVTLTHEQTGVTVAPLIDAYCADMAIVEARQKSIENAFLRIGNAARALGTDGGQPWSTPLPDPSGKLPDLGFVRIAAGRALALATPSSKTVEIAGKKYGYIFNPRTGLPAEGVALAAVSGNIATKCSVVAHALVVAGIEGASDVLKNFPGCEALIVPEGQPVVLWMTPGFAKQTDLPEALRGNVRTIEVPAAPGS